MHKSVKATFTFSHNIKLTHLTSIRSEKYTIPLVGVVMKKIWLLILQCKVGVV